LSLLNKNDLIQRYNKNQAYLLSDEGEKNYSKNKLIEHGKSFSYLSSYDIFLSHSYDDARLVRLIKEMLEEKGFSVYVDWIEDKQLDRGRVTKSTAEILRQRMNTCASLIYLTSESAERSLWMPWELGYMDSRTGLVAVAPIIDENKNFEGREYLGLYPYIDLTNDNFYIHRSTNEWVNLKGWMAGEQPKVFNLL